MASCRRTGAMRDSGNSSASAASTRPAMARDQSANSGALIRPGRSLGPGIEIAQRLAVEDRDARLRVGELAFAELDQLGAALVGRERLLERQLAVLHARDEGLELLERALESEV